MSTRSESARRLPVEPHLRLVPPPPRLRAVDPPLDRAIPPPVALVAESPGYPPLEHSLIGRIAVAAYEIVEGVRQVSQLARWITPGVAAQLSTVRALNIERRSFNRDSRRVVPTAQSVHSSSPTPGTIEATVLLNTPRRTRAAALRFEFRRGGWRASYLAVI